MNFPTTPLEREILTHYWSTPGPYLGGSENWKATHGLLVQKFVDLGLLVRYDGEDGFPHIRGNQDALRLYMEALSMVPLPVQRWIIPDNQKL